MNEPEHTLYDSDQDYDEKAILMDAAVCLEKDPEDITEEQLLTQLSIQRDIAWEDFSSEFGNWLADHTFLLTGSLGLWKGRITGYRLVRGWDDFQNLLWDYDSVKITENSKGRVFVKLIHHDGTHYLELRKLTPAGERFIEEKSGTVLELGALSAGPTYTRNARYSVPYAGGRPKQKGAKV